MPVAIQSFAFVGNPVTDVPRARRFYEQVLGLTPSEVHNWDEKWWIEYDVAGTTVAISNTWPPSGSGATIAFEVADLDAALSAIREAGTEPSFGPMDSPVCRFFGVKDPDGNDLMIHRRHPAAPTPHQAAS